MREEVVRLKDDTEPPAHADSVDRGIGDHLAVEEDVAVVDVLEQIDAAKERRLAGAGRADQSDGLVLGDLEVDASKDFEIAEGLGHAANFDHRAFIRVPSPGSPTSRGSARAGS